MSGTLAPEVAVKPAAAFVADGIPPGMFSCACTAHTMPQTKNAGTSSLFMIFPLRADPTPGINH